MIYNKCGIISIIGKANVGKSTLINSIFKKNISITNKKPNTTNKNITGIKTIKNKQIILTDTPGIKITHPHKLESKYIKYTLSESNIIVFVIDISNINYEDIKIIETIKNTNIPIILAINKIDKLNNKKELLDIIHKIKNKIKIQKIITISAIKNIRVNILEKYISYLLPIKTHIYKKGIETNITEQFFIKEKIREQLFNKLNKELPYILKINIDNIVKTNKKLLITVTIQIKKPSQKSIIIGKNGKMIKNIIFSTKKILSKTYKKIILIKININYQIKQNQEKK